MELLLSLRRREVWMDKLSPSLTSFLQKKHNRAFETKASDIGNQGKVFFRENRSKLPYPVCPLVENKRYGKKQEKCASEMSTDGGREGMWKNANRMKISVEI